MFNLILDVSSVRVFFVFIYFILFIFCLASACRLRSTTAAVYAFKDIIPVFKILLKRDRQRDIYWLKKLG